MTPNGRLPAWTTKALLLAVKVLATAVVLGGGWWLNNLYAEVQDKIPRSEFEQVVKRLTGIEKSIADIYQVLIGER